MDEKKPKYGNKTVLLHPNGQIEKITRRALADLNKLQAVPAGATPFDSSMEAQYYRDVLEPLLGGLIASIELQPKYILIPAFETDYGRKVLAHSYTPDFLVTYADGQKVAIDVKGFADQRFPINRKLFEYQLGIRLNVMKHVKKFGGWLSDDEYKARKKAEKTLPLKAKL